MRFHPNRRASIDHRPGPNIARAAPNVATRMYSVLGACAVRKANVSVRATRVPTIGVNSPRVRRIPAVVRRADTIAVAAGGSLSAVEPTLSIKTVPTTTRIRMRPTPGQPPAKVEYKRRNGRTSPIRNHSRKLASKIEPQKEVRSTLFRGEGCEKERLAPTYSSMIPRFRAMVVA